jgi:hypothetical protein
MSGGAQWLTCLSDSTSESTADGLVLIKGYKREGRPPEEVAMMEKAEAYHAHAVFFEAGRNDRPPVAQAFVFISDGPANDPKFGELHRKLWSWGGVPLLYRRTPGLVQLFRCGHKPDFLSQTGEIICKPFKTLKIAGNISQELSPEPWWDSARLRNGTLWDDPAICKKILSADKAAHKLLIDEVKQLYAELDEKGILKKHLRRKLLVLSLLIAYLEERGIFPPNYFGQFHDGATEFFEVLAHGEALVELLKALETRFNGNVFVLSDADRESLRSNGQLAHFADLVEGRKEPGGQLTLWKRYSFGDLPVELISHIYQLFVEDTDGSVYTPPFLVRLMLDEALSWERLDRLERNNEIILDPCCGSGVFLVEAYKRLVLHWRYGNKWEKPRKTVLTNLLEKVHGIDSDQGATELTAFSLCLALCDALETDTLRKSIKLFPPLVDKTIHHSCFFDAKETGLIKEPIGVVVGNPPFKSKLNTPGAKRSYERYEKEQGSLPDKQLAYLFLHEAMEMVTEGGVLSMLQQYNFLYNQLSLDFRRNFIKKWDVREVLDFISVQGIFTANTKVVVVVAEASMPPADRKILHATFRRSGRVDSQQGFDIDYYDLHWLPRQLVLSNDGVWRTDLLGGGRVLGFVDRLKKFRTLGKYGEEQRWDYGEGFIEGKRSVSHPADHIVGKPLLPSEALTLNGIDITAITNAQDKPIERPRSETRFSPPMLLVREHMDIPHAIWLKHYLTYKNKIVGFAAPKEDCDQLSKVDRWLASEATALRAYAASVSVRLFTQRATTLSGVDILALPYPEAGTLDLGSNEQILVEDIVNYYRDLILRSEKSAVMKERGHKALPDFTGVYTRQINAIYKKNPLQALEPQTWPGVICQPFVFGKGKADWRGVEELRSTLDAILHDKQGTSLHVTRIARIYDGSFVFLLKPDRLRYWLRSIALRDADETLADLRAQGF